MERRNYLPDGLIPDEIGEKSDNIIEEIYKNPNLKKSMEELESTILSAEYKYISQIASINKCVKEIFWDNFIINNRFLLRLWNIVDSYHKLKIDSNNKELQNKYKRDRIDVRQQVNECSRNFFRKLEKDNPDLGFQELIRLSSKYDNKFIELILERIQYVPDNENKIK